jgi:uncharacterized protein (DUF1697 family)
MTAHVALWRGVNVGGARGLPMIVLRALFETAGALGVEHPVSEVDRPD